jgi:LPS sulfotransferase NodH
MSVSQKGKLFLVGCPRSGTTLLQSLLASHPEIISFPESHFFRKLISKRALWHRIFQIASPVAKSHFHEFLHQIGHEEMKSYLPNNAIFLSQYTQAFVSVLDELTRQQNKSFWLEKTPGHLRYVDYIENMVPHSKFIHIVRNGIDVVASLYDVTHRYPQIWGKPYDIDKCIQDWTRAIRQTSSHSHKLNHFVVRYEKLVENPHDILGELCDFIGTDFNEKMLQNYQITAKQVTLTHESWKEAASNTIVNKNDRKFYDLFNEEQRFYILEKLSNINLDDLEFQLN